MEARSVGVTATTLRAMRESRMRAERSAVAAWSRHAKRLCRNASCLNRTASSVNHFCSRRCAREGAAYRPVLFWADVPGRERVTAEWLDEHYAADNPYLPSMLERALRRYRGLVDGSKCAAAVSFYWDTPGQSPFLPCGLSVLSGELFCPTHGGRGLDRTAIKREREEAKAQARLAQERACAFMALGW